MKIDLHLGNCLTIMDLLPNESVDLTVTSPPYDTLRDYSGEVMWNEDVWKSVLDNIFRLTKAGGCCVWIVSDETRGGSESGTSFKQALYAKEIGFNLHDTMIWNKGSFAAVGALRTRYAPVFEYMFVFSKGKVKTFNPIKDKPNKHAGTKIRGTIREKNGSVKRMSNEGKQIGDFGQRFNIWENGPQRQRGVDAHPAPFPVNLCTDHIESWSNPGDTVLDPFMGSGTTGVASVQKNRNFIGIEIYEKYFDAAKKRIEAERTLAI